MSAKLLIISQDFKDQFKNGVLFADNPGDFTVNLAGSVMENIRVTRQIDISTTFAATASNGSTGIAILSPGVVEFTKPAGQKWINEKFATGDSILITWNDVSGAQNSTGLIGSITNNVMIVTGMTLPGPGLNGWVNNTTVMWITTPSTALDYYFGLVDNGETNVDPASKVTGNDQGYYAAGIGLGAPRSTSFVNMLRLGLYADWDTGSMRVRFVQNSVLLHGEPIVQRFELEHIFSINPWYLAGQLSDYQNGIAPLDLAGANSYKYVFSARFKDVLSNPNTEKQLDYTDDLGSVAWFNENFNGYNNLYKINSIAYTEQATGNSADGLLVASKTRVTIQVEALLRNFKVGERVGVYVIMLPDQSEYTNKTATDMLENYLYDNALGNAGGTTAGQTFITQLSVFSEAGTDNLLDLFFDVEYSAAQKAFLSQRLQNQPTHFLIGVQVGDVTVGSGNSDKVIILSDVELYDESPDIPGLMDVTKFDIYPHNKQIGIDTGFTDYLGWNEDGVVIDFEFSLNLAQQAVINLLQFKLIAYNDVTGDFFELDSFDFPNIGNAQIVAGVQQLLANTTRGYNLASGDQFNDVQLSTDLLVVQDQFYSGRFGQKFKWQDWLQNLAVDNVFFNAAKPNNNKNFRSSNYSDLFDFTIRLAAFANVDGVNQFGVGGNTNYLFVSPEIPTYDYDLDGNITPIWTGVIETFHPITAVNLQGAVLIGQDTIMRTTWTHSGGPVASVVGMWAIHRIEETNQNGDAIDELSTINPFPVPNRVIPLITETQLKIDPIAGNVVTESRIDGSQILTGIQYNLSSRLNEDTPLDGKITEQAVFKETEAAMIKIVE